MKILLVLVAAIFLSCATDNVATESQSDCESTYLERIERVKNTTQLSQPEKERYLPKLEEAYKLCKEGKTNEAREILDGLRKEEVFRVYDGH